jgi:hypothetical protein
MSTQVPKVIIRACWQIRYYWLDLAELECQVSRPGRALGGRRVPKEPKSIGEREGASLPLIVSTHPLPLLASNSS